MVIYKTSKKHFKKTVIKRSSLSESLICYFAGQILESLHYLHMNKIIHMDITQKNVLIDEYLNAKLPAYYVKKLNYQR